jgi:hypothetical protein
MDIVREINRGKRVNLEELKSYIEKSIQEYHGASDENFEVTISKMYQMHQIYPEDTHPLDMEIAKPSANSEKQEYLISAPIHKIEECYSDGNLQTTIEQICKEFNPAKYGIGVPLENLRPEKFKLVLHWRRLPTIGSCKIANQISFRFGISKRPLKE